MQNPHLVCVLEGSGDPIFSANTFDYKMAEGDLFMHTVGGVTTNYKVESSVLEVESLVGNPSQSNWTRFVLRVTASIVP